MRTLAVVRTFAVVLALFSGGGCLPRTELMVGLMSDLTVGSELQAVQLQAENQGVAIVQKAWPVDGPLVLPGSFGLFSGDGAAVPITVLVRGYRVGDTSASIERTAQVTLQDGATL